MPVFPSSLAILRWCASVAMAGALSPAVAPAQTAPPAGTSAPPGDPAPGVASVTPPHPQPPAMPVINSAREDGYRGIWFALGQRSPYGDKYSGGLATYTAKHLPLAIYAAEVEKTFFVFGAGKQGTRHLLAMASYYDHRRRTVPRPTVVHDKQGVSDPHDNPSLALDEYGHLWVFVSGRGRHRKGFIYRSLEPYSTAAFEQVLSEELTYPQPWWVPGQGFLHLFTKYTGGRELYFSTSGDGRVWSEATKLAGMGGHYQISHQRGQRVLTAFNFHPGGNVDRRTNLYFAQTHDMGRSWQSVSGQMLELPLQTPESPALVHDFQSAGRLVYLKDIQLDAFGLPVVLVITAAHSQPGPRGNPRHWVVVAWDGNRWQQHIVTEADHNYDMGSLYIEAEDCWRIMAPTQPGPQTWGAGGEIAIWTSHDRGATWRKTKDVTRDSRRNHLYVRRPVHARQEFYALWADGNPLALSPSHYYVTNTLGSALIELPGPNPFARSHLYFCDRSGAAVWRLPYQMDGAEACPEPYQRGGRP